MWIFSGLKKFGKRKDDEGWGIFIRQRIIRGFSCSPFVQQAKHWQNLIPPKGNKNPCALIPKVHHMIRSTFFRQFGPLRHQEENLVSNLRAFPKRVTTTGGGIFFCWFGVGRYEKTLRWDAIFEENKRMFGQLENMLLYLHNDSTISGTEDVIIEVLGLAV